MEDLRSKYPSEEETRPATSEPDTPPKAKRSIFRRAFRGLQWAITILAVILALLVFTPLGDWHARMLIETAPPVESDYILVLGGQLERAVEAARLYQEGWAPKVIFSIAAGSREKYARVAEAYGSPREAMIFDEAPYRTNDHPETVANLPGIDRTKRFLMLTSPFHTARAAACFREAGYGHITPVTVGWRTGGEFTSYKGSYISRGKDLTEKLYETLAWGMYKLRGWL